jgi:hypothetical protein
MYARDYGFTKVLGKKLFERFRIYVHTASTTRAKEIQYNCNAQMVLNPHPLQA